MFAAFGCLYRISLMKTETFDFELFANGFCNRGSRFTSLVWYLAWVRGRGGGRVRKGWFRSDEAIWRVLICVFRVRVVGRAPHSRPVGWETRNPEQFVPAPP
jgi:hypothetical protein